MMRNYKIFFLAVVFLLVNLQSARSQPSTSGDSLIYYLRSIQNPADTNKLKAFFVKFISSPEAAFEHDSIATEILTLKTKLNDLDYYTLMDIYFAKLLDFNTQNAYEKALKVSHLFWAEYQPGLSKYGHYTLIGIFRDMRIPYRNLGKLNACIEYFQIAEKKYMALNDSDVVSIADNVLSTTYFRLGIIEKAKYYQLKSISYMGDKQSGYSVDDGALILGRSGKVNRYAVLGSYYVIEKRPDLAEPYLKKAIQIYHKLDSPLLCRDATFLFLQMACCKTLLKSDSSSYYYESALHYLKMYHSPPLEYANFYQERGNDFISKKLYDSAFIYIQKSSRIRDSLHLGIISYFGNLLPEYYKGLIDLEMGKAKEAVPYLQEEYNRLKQINLRAPLVDCLNLLAQAYSLSGENLKAYQTLHEAFSIKNEIEREINDARDLNFETEKKMQEKENDIMLLNAQNQNNKKIRYYLIGMLSVLAVLVVMLWIFYSNKRKSNTQLASKNEVLAKTLEQLKSTQKQLIQSEKMASLGELTAGIAHEIQNPLNFVNNFSDVNQELLSELKEEADKGNIEDVKAIADDVISNSEKINHHGKRADAIVKGMLQHSRKSTGVKEPTDINALCDEYLRLSYHGMRAKDKSFNAEMKTDFDETLPKINVVPQDIGRVILNLINNAFYAVNEKSKTNTGFVPQVTIVTKKLDDKIEIKVSDNGNGIPEKIKDKIFQPFFTTKPTGEGTGLGLSLSYDMIKAHGGDLKVETQEGEGTEFIILLPIN